MSDFLLGLLTAVAVTGAAGAYFFCKFIQKKLEAIDDELAELAGVVCDYTFELEGGGDDPDGGIPVDDKEDEEETAVSGKVLPMKPRKAA
jgi:hypothetical protein